MASTNNLTTLRQNVIEKIEERKQLDRGMKSLGKSQKAALGQMEAEKSILDRQIHETTASYSKASCRQLCTQVITRLPRELRDVITTHVVTADYIYVGPQYLANKGPTCEKDRDVHFFQESYVGDMLIEIVQAWYRHTLFYFWDKERNADVVERFMVTDRWCLGIKPYEHISRVRFDLGSKTLHSSINCRGLTHAFCDIDNFHSLLVGPLKALAQFPIPNRAHFVIRIHTLGSFAEGCLSHQALQSILEDLLTELRGLRSVGHHFIVQWSELKELEFSSSSSDTRTMMTAEEWLKAIRLVCRVVALRIENKRASLILRKTKELNAARKGWGKIHNKTQIAVESYAQASCRTLCDSVHSSFPREVRDMIYRHLLVEWPDVENDDGYWHSERRDAIILFTTEYLHHVRIYKHLTQPEFMGNDVVQEIQEVFFQTTRFEIAADSSSILKFRTADPFSHGVMPADNEVTLQLRVDCGSHLFEGLDRRRTRGWGHREDRTETSDLLLHLECLFSFQKGSKFIVDLQISAYDFGGEDIPLLTRTQWLWDNVIPAVFPTLRRLNKAGYKVTVRLDSDDFLVGLPYSVSSLADWTTRYHKMKIMYEKTEAEETDSAPDGDEDGDLDSWEPAGQYDDRYVGVQGLLSAPRD